MSLTDIMSGANLAGYAEVGLVLFLLSFIAISVWVFSKRNDANWEAMRHLPLDEGTSASSSIVSNSVSSLGGQP